MTVTVYTVIAATKLRSSKAPELWHIFHKEDFGLPILLHRCVQKILPNDYPSTNVSYKLELYEGNKEELKISHQPMLIQYRLQRGKRIYKPFVHYPNGAVQNLRDFLNSWKRTLISLDKYYNLNKKT